MRLPYELTNASGKLQFKFKKLKLFYLYGYKMLHMNKCSNLGRVNACDLRCVVLVA